jgi:putative protease
MHGVNHQELVHARFGKKRGPFVGRIQRVGPDFVEVDQLPEFSVEPGDGLVFDTGGDTNREQGGRVYEVRGRAFYFQHGKIHFRDLRPGDRIWKTDDPKLEAELRKTFAKDPPPRRQPLSLQVSGRCGEALVLSARGVRVMSAVSLQKAEKRPLTIQALREQLGRLGDTPWELDGLESELEEGVMLPISELNRMRRELVDKLGSRMPEPVAGENRITGWRDLLPPSESWIPGPPSLSALCRTMDQIKAAQVCGIQTVLLDFEDVRRYHDAVLHVRAGGSTQVFLATPRIQKAGEQGFFKLIENAEPDGVLVRNLGALDYFRTSPLRKIGDFSLNVANPLTAALLKQEGLESLTVSYDLNADQVLDLVRSAPPSWFEITLHQHMPMFHMEHCVFAAFLSEGKDHLTCGRPCDRHHIALRDRVGMEHPVKADVGCRNTVYHERAQSGARFLEQFRAAGLSRFRIEFLLETAAQAEEVLRNYQALLSGQVFPEELSRRLKVADQLGVTSGTLTVLR